ncbi:hypothetical protein A3762_03590 [Oleiphilus sp. HI0125]|uniref:molybdopterin molybdotransferase MoeA n=2 Tax=Oleiphilus sp. HI0125 TaxID=1822266 RepID=UPI0007C2F505|nr:gephyrin-like molybdotransferase Glp [Oleiphilus sp. HI0125]KZZ60067.1 hypothetical protein A3762_03590 [Oleiphilus sp. HI0125]
MSASKLLPLEDAIEQLSSRVQTCSQEETTPIEQALNRVSASDIKARISQPPFHNSAVDGYAFRISDIQKSALPVTMRVPAGSAPGQLKEGEAARIFTGAPVPEGADCVLMQESAELSELNGTTLLSTSSNLSLNQNLRPAGQDFQVGDTLLRKGDVLRPQNISLLASSGIAEIKTYRPLTVAVVSTGDELAQPGSELKPGQIYNSNQYLLEGLIRSFGFEVRNIGCVADKLDATIEALNKAAESDIIISSGGASVGEEDYIKAAIEELGEIDFWRIAIKPGKPFMLGKVGDTPILGLPGNPSAVLVTFLMLARSVLLKRQGCRVTQIRTHQFPLGFNWKKASIRREFIRVRLNEDNQIIAHPNQSSGMMSSSCWAEGFAVIPENTCPQAGDLVTFIPFSHLLQLPETTLDQ